MKNTGAGFTLIELLLVISLLALSVGVTSDILVSLVRTNAKTTVLNDIEQTANFISTKLEKELRNAEQITAPVVGSPGNVLTFVTRNGDRVVYSVDENTNYNITRQINTYRASFLSFSDMVNISCITKDACFRLIQANCCTKSCTSTRAFK